MTDVRDLSPEARRLADLLPAMLVTTDAEQPDRPLLRLLEVLAAPLSELRAAVRRLERDPFVSRSSPEALTLLADLVGARLVGEDVATNRRVVAGTVRWRRRQGTLTTLEEVLTQTTGWPAEVDEGFRSLLVTQELSAPLPSRGWTALLWDPVALADPLTRRARRPERHPSAALDAPRSGEDVVEALRRLGAPDALRLASAARTVDLDGWARPDAVVVRTSRVAVAERDQVVLGGPLALAPTGVGGPLHGLRLDPGGLDGPIAARVVAEPATADLGLTAVHEPPPRAGLPRRPELLTPTDLAADALAVAEGDALRLTVDGVPLLGAAAPTGSRRPVPFGPPGAAPVLRFADAGRPGPLETWDLALAAVDDLTAVATTLATDTPPVGLGDVNPVALRATAGRGAATLETTDAGGAPRGAAEVALRLSRTEGDDVAWRRDPAGTWAAGALAPHPGEPVSGCVLLADGGAGLVVRLVRLPVADGPDDLALASHSPGSPTWDIEVLDVDALPAQDRPGTVWLDPGPAALLVPDGADALVVAPDPAGTATRAWRLTGIGTASVALQALDPAAERRPGPREAAAACLVGDVLTLHGGEHDGAALLDVWQLHLAGPLAGRWVLRRVRGRIARSGGHLLATAEGLVRVGGAAEQEGLTPSIARVDLDAPRPRWEPLPDLPVPLAVGAAWARVDGGGGLEVLAWADRTAPRLLRLPPGSARWQVGAPETGAPNPPAEGEVLADGDVWVVVGPSPLPPSEVVVTVLGQGRLVFVPALDPSPADAPEIVLLDTDGSTRRWFPEGVAARPRLRLGRTRETGAVRGRTAPAAARVGALGRLGWTPLRARQASLGPWDRPLALALDDAVALDPRLGRLVVDAALTGLHPPGTAPVFAASYHVARGVGLGAGFVPPGGALPGRWQEPPDPLEPARFVLPVPPEHGRPGRPPVPAAAVVGPAGWVTSDGADVLTGLDAALDLAADLAADAAADEGTASDARAAAVIDVLGSPRLPAATCVAREGAVTSVVARDPGGYPFVVPDGDGVSVSLLERADDGGSADVGPHVMVTGLALGGVLDVALTSGEIDLRWCDLGLSTGDAGVRVAGAGHHTELLRATPATVSLVLRLHGCRVARLEVPPWVRVVAAGCTFDAGDRAAPAIAAAGASLRLRECTVRGTTAAGILEATSSVFAGAVVCDRPDLGWLRRSVAPRAADRRPPSWRGISFDVSFAEGRPTWPAYLVLDDNNPGDVLTIGDGRRPPGAYGDRGRARRELDRRTDDFLPLGLAAHHRDRATDDVHRMGRRLS